MALLGNYSQFMKNPILNVGGDSTSGIVGLRSNWNTAGDSRGRFYGENWLQGTADRYGLPSGYASPYSWVLPPKNGGIGSNVGIAGIGTFTGSGALGINIDAILAGTGTISDANMGLILSAVATLSGIGGFSADVLGALQASADLAGSGDMNGSLGALAGAVATLSGTGALTGSSIALAHISADIYVNQSTATVNELVAGVWNALASEFNTSGTMGQKLNGAGSAGDPWTTDLGSYITAGTAGALMKKASKPKISL
jgi:hypothetical protein